ncbi:hypothetical protein [Tessaracoccus flavus]|uniref:hypothetical protein n=1 Tax=Tessaracoccus flavus TaxID=1610493 RepID=UPI0012FBE88A|nr:hypothetical protein [Tessaracoccus flavus]
MVTLEAEDSEQWVGQWTVTFVDPNSASAGKKARTSIYIAGDLTPRFVEQDEPFRTGDSYPLRFEVINSAGDAVDPSTLLGEVALDVSILGEDGDPRSLATLGADTLNDAVELDTEGLEPGKQTLRMRLNVTTADAVLNSGESVSGTELTPQVVDVPLVIEPPLGYPSLDGMVDFGAAEGPPALSATLKVKGPGCLWLVPNSAVVEASPVEVTQASISSANSTPDSCFSVSDGLDAELPLLLTSDDAGNGALQGTFDVSMMPLEGGETQTLPVRFTAELSKDLNPTSFWLTLVIAALFGPGIPILLAYLLKFLLASKIPPGGLLAVSMDVEVHDGSVLRDGRRLAWRAEDAREFKSVTGGGTRRLEVGGAVLVARMGASPFGSGYVLVEAGDRIGVSKHKPMPHGRRRQALLPLALTGQWVALFTPGDRQHVELLVLTAPGARPEARDALLEDAERRVPALIDELVEDAGDTDTPGNATAAAAGDPFGLDGGSAGWTPSASPRLTEIKRATSDRPSKQSPPMAPPPQASDDQSGSWDPFAN